MKTKNIQHSSKTKKFPIFGILKKKVKKNTHTKEKRKKKSATDKSQKIQSIMRIKIDQ